MLCAVVFVVLGVAPCVVCIACEWRARAEVSVKVSSAGAGSKQVVKGVSW